MLLDMEIPIVAAATGYRSSGTDCHSTDLEGELGLDTKMLTKDRRNFHAWNYRRNVVKQLESATLNGHSMVEAEFEFTTKMIRVDLSNFSAWHNRSRLIPRLLEERGADDATRRKFFDDGKTKCLIVCQLVPDCV